jgi:hypothetical protein
MWTAATPWPQRTDGAAAYRRHLVRPCVATGADRPGTPSHCGNQHVHNPRPKISPRPRSRKNEASLLIHGRKYRCRSDGPPSDSQPPSTPEKRRWYARPPVVGVFVGLVTYTVLKYVFDIDEQTSVGWAFFIGILATGFFAGSLRKLRRRKSLDNAKGRPTKPLRPCQSQ